MKPYSSEIKSVKTWLEELSRIRELMEDLQNGVVAIENDLNALDAALPGDAEIAAMPEGSAKSQLVKLLNLLNEAYQEVDDMLGAPEDGQPGRPLLSGRAAALAGDGQHEDEPQCDNRRPAAAHHRPLYGLLAGGPRQFRQRPLPGRTDAADPAVPQQNGKLGDGKVHRLAGQSLA